MKNRDSILKELDGLGSNLTTLNPQPIYAVPAGYFEELAENVLSRIKAMESSSKTELQVLSPLLSRISRETPFQVPVGYFESLTENIMTGIYTNADNQTRDEEIASLSPLLSKINKKVPYEVPVGYFDNLKVGSEKKEETRIVSIKTHSWYRLAAAAVIIGIIAIGGILFYNQNKIDPAKNPDEWVVKNVEKKISSEQLDEFVNLAASDENFKTSKENDQVKSEEIIELMKDVSEKEIQEFLNETVVLDPKSEADVLLN